MIRLKYKNEYFYIKRNNRPYLMGLIEEEFIYTPDQMTVLIEDLDDDE